MVGSNRLAMFNHGILSNISDAALICLKGIWLASHSLVSRSQQFRFDCCFDEVFFNTKEEQGESFEILLTLVAGEYKRLFLPQFLF
jgi:hypothetical protein